VIYSIAFSGLVTIFTRIHRIEQFACEWNAADADLVEIDLGSISGFVKARVESEQLELKTRLMDRDRGRSATWRDVNMQTDRLLKSCFLA
jgi:hypothetical protein